MGLLGWARAAGWDACCVNVVEPGKQGRTEWAAGMVLPGLPHLQSSMLHAVALRGALPVCHAWQSTSPPPPAPSALQGASAAAVRPAAERAVAVAASLRGSERQVAAAAELLERAARLDAAGWAAAMWAVLGALQLGA